MTPFIDTHAHIDGPEFDADRAEVIARAREAGAQAIFVPAIDLPSSRRIIALCRHYPGYLYPMVGLHPEEVRPDWPDVLRQIKSLTDKVPPSPLPLPSETTAPSKTIEAPSGAVGGAGTSGADTPGAVGGTSDIIAIGEVGLDFYWSREYEREQLQAFEAQVQWSIETGLPLMIHCRKAQNELVQLLKHYADELPGGVFHCFTGNAIEAAELLQFPRFVLGVGGVSTFKKSHLPEVLPAAVPLDRLVLETDAPYMAPVPLRGQRNEPAYVVHVLQRLAQAYGVSEAELAQRTTHNALRVFRLKS